MNFPKKLLKLRKERHLSQKQLAEISGFSQSAINYWEKGERNPSMDTVRILADALKVPLDELVDDIAKDNDHFFEMHVTDPETQGHLYALHQLTDEGKSKDYKYAEDLTLIKDYRKDGMLPLKYRLGKPVVTKEGNTTKITRKVFPDLQKEEEVEIEKKEE